MERSSKTDLEEAVVHANISIKRWAETKPNLLNHEAIRSVVIHNIVTCINKATTDWRQRLRGRSSMRPVILNIDKERLCITSVEFFGTLYAGSITEKLQYIFNSFDYHDLNNRAVNILPTIYTEVGHISLKSLEDINFKIEWKS